MSKQRLSKLKAVFYSLLIFFLTASPVLAEDNALILQGIEEFKKENYEEALSNFKSARIQEPKSSTAAYYTGITYKAMEDYPSAEKHLKDAISLTPVVPDAYLELADVYNTLDKTDDAIKLLSEAEKAGIRPADTTFLKGIIFQKKKRYAEALENFEKAKKLDSKLTQAADYQSGLIYVAQGKLNFAETVFNEVIKTDPNTDMALFASQYTKEIQKHLKGYRPLRFNLTAYWQYDSNVVLKPSDSSISTPATENDDSGEVAMVSIDYTKKFEGGLSLKTSYSFYGNNNDNVNTHDVTSHTLSLMPNYSSGRSIYNLLLSYNISYVETRDYLKAWTVAPTYMFAFSQTNLLQVGGRVQGKLYSDPPIMPAEDRDGTAYGGNLGWFYFFMDSRGALNLRYEYTLEDTVGSNWSYQGHRGIATLSLPVFRSSVKAVFNAEYAHQGFANEHSAFGVVRRDNSYTGAVLLSWEIFKDFELQSKFTYIKNSSNIPLYEYDRNITNVGFSWTY